MTATLGLSTAAGFQTIGNESSVLASPVVSPPHPAPRPVSRTPSTHPTRTTNDHATSRPQTSTKPDKKVHVAAARPSPVAQSQGRRIARIAASHIGAKFQIGATGMRYFDCSGLIYRVFSQAGQLDKIGGNRAAAGYYYWFKARGQANRHSPKVGDLVIWTEKGQIAHSGIYVGGGRVISALINPWGVKKTHINTIHAKFLAFLHVRW